MPRPHGMRDVDTLRCVQEKLEEARRFQQARAEAAAKVEADAAAARDSAAALTAAGAGGSLTEKTFVIGGHGTSSRKRLVGAGAFIGGASYADSHALARLLRGQGARVVDLAVEPRDSVIFAPGGALTIASNPHTIMVLSDGYDRDCIEPRRQRPRWLDCFRTQERAVKESYIEALAAAEFDFDRVPLGPHLVYEPGSGTPRPV